MRDLASHERLRARGTLVDLAMVAAMPKRPCAAYSVATYRHVLVDIGQARAA